MFILDEQQKMDIIIETCKKIDNIYFKFYAINLNFKNLKNKLSDYDHIKKLKNIEYWSALDVFNFENSYKMINKDIKRQINKKIDLFEDQDITFFIKYYDVTFEEDKKKFCIEI
jgi:hypothetical protein